MSDIYEESLKNMENGREKLKPKFVLMFQAKRL